MEQFFENRVNVFVVTLLAGVVLGYIFLRPVFLFVSRPVKKRNKKLGVLLEKLANSSIPLGIILLLNIIASIPFFHLDAEWSNKAVHTITILGLTYIVCEVLLYVYDLYLTTKSKQVTSIFHIVIRLLTYSFGVFALLKAFGIQITPILTALGVGGLAIALALQDTLTNLFAGIQILGSRQVKPGDYIRLDSGEEGYVLDINWRNTEIKTLLGNFVIIPNSRISSSITTNYYTLQQRLYFHVIVGVHYNSDLEQVERVTMEVAESLMSDSEMMPKSLKPRVRFFDFSDSSISMRVWLSTDTYENQFALKHEFIKRLHKRFEQEGIVIPFPIRTLHLGGTELAALSVPKDGKSTL